MKDKGDSAFDDVISGTNTKEEPPSDHETESKPTSSKNRSQKSDIGTDGVESSPGEQGGTVGDSEPQFDFSAVTQRPMYVRPGTWEEVEDTKYYAEGVLREEYGVRNVATRELDEVLAQIIVEEVSAELIAQRLVELRGFDP